MKKPIIVFLTYTTCLTKFSKFADVRYHNCTMPSADFMEKCRGADLIMEQEFNDGKAKYGTLLDKVKIPKAVWLIDSHCRRDHPEYAKHFNHIFVAINRKRSIFSMPTHHLPVACPFEPDNVSMYTGGKNWDVGFVGQFLRMGNRDLILNQLQKDLDKERLSHNFTTAYGEDYFRIHRQSRVCFNKSIADELNFRVFEVMGMGVPQVTDWNTELDLIPELKERVFCYSGYTEIMPRIKDVLKMDPVKLRDKLVDNQRWMLEKHMNYHRFLKIAETALGYTLKEYA